MYDIAGITPVAERRAPALRIQGESAIRCRHSATVEYGQIQGTTENYREGECTEAFCGKCPCQFAGAQ